MTVILAFPALAGMDYPALAERALLRVVPDPDSIRGLDAADRAAVRVLMTSASRGCSVQMIETLPSLGLVVSQGAGLDKIDIPALKARGIRFRNIGETQTEDVADLAMALTQMLCRRLLLADGFARSGAWVTARFDLGDSLYGMTMGIAGLSGRIGQAIAARARASGMQIAGLNRASNAGLGHLHDGWQALAAASDVLVMAVPGTDDLTGIIDGPVLAALGPKGRLVNVGRGNLVNMDALIHALETGAIAGAALDVIDSEPQVPARLAALQNVILTPHIGAQTWGQRARAAQIAEAEILAYLAADG
ncbi:MAG: glyoxylate reductase [Rhodobacteraceae bacterium PARR1]|nr:MAG: glyoxylate reductase [Rhodobacteraceae bacterium PARR1]